MKLSFSLSGPSLERRPLLPALETSCRVSCLKNCTLLAQWRNRETSVLLQGVGRGREGEPGAVFSSCWIFPEAISSPHLQQNGNKRTKIIQMKLLFCVSQQPFEQAKMRESFFLTQPALQLGEPQLSRWVFSTNLFPQRTHMVWTLLHTDSLNLVCFLSVGGGCVCEDRGWGSVRGEGPQSFLFLSLQLLLLFLSARQSI